MTIVQTLNRDYWQKAFANLATTFEEEKVHLCHLDGVIGDGDHGASMARGFAEATKRLSSLGTPPSIHALFATTGSAFLDEVGGVTGVIFGTFFLDASKNVENLTEIDADTLRVMLETALEGIKKRGRVREGDKSMIDALAPAVASLRQTIANGSDLNEMMESLHQAAHHGMEETKRMAAKVGRVRYQKEKGVGQIDPGSASVALIFRTLRDTWRDNAPQG
jgi:phosphoenolpyruvate---glycerone phosphotransferase subunit DhaL